MHTIKGGLAASPATVFLSPSSRLGETSCLTNAIFSLFLGYSTSRGVISKQCTGPSIR